LPVRYDLKFHDGMMRRAVQFGSLEQADIVGPALVPHKVVDIPTWRGASQERNCGGTAT